MTIEFDTAILQEVLQQLPSPPVSSGSASPSVFVGKIDGQLANA